METVQNRVLEIRMIASTIMIIRVERLLFDTTKLNPHFAYNLLIIAKTIKCVNQLKKKASLIQLLFFGPGVLFEDLLLLIHQHISTLENNFNALIFCLEIRYAY